MADPTLVIQVDQIGRRLGIEQPLAEDDRWIIQEALQDAQSDVVGYLGRPVLPQRFTQRGVWPAYGGSWDLDEDPVLSIESFVREHNPVTGRPSGTWTVVYTAGLDAAHDPALGPIRRFIKAHAFYSAEVQAMYRRIAPDLARVAETVTVTGQSVRYTRTFANTDAPGSNSPGTLPTLASCDKWRRSRRRVFQRPTQPGADQPFPHDWPIGATRYGGPYPIPLTWRDMGGEYGPWPYEDEGM